jgi:8-oxo-dGTP pyrophosphatase MutT (NUDIX family)
VLLARGARVEADLFRATFFPVAFSSFLAFRDAGFPDPGVVNAFALAAIRSADGAFVLGVQASHTANAGRAYFPAGTPDLDDVRGDRVDLDGSVMRELREETGLGPESGAVGAEWTIVDSGPMVALFRPIALHHDAASVERTILEHIERDPEPELAGVRLVHGPADIDPAVMPAYLVAFLRDAYALGR